MTAAAASCPLGPAHAVIKMRTHQHTIHCSPAPAGETIQFLVTREAPALAPAAAAAAAPVYSPAAQPRVTAARHGQMLQLPGRGGAGAGSPGGGADCDNILCTALDWPPAYTGRPPPRRPGFIGAVFSRAACNPRLGRAADCHILAHVTCHVSHCPHPRPGPALTVLLGSCAAVWVSAHWTLLGHRCPLHRHAL